MEPPILGEADSDCREGQGTGAGPVAVLGLEELPAV